MFLAKYKIKFCFISLKKFRSMLGNRSKKTIYSKLLGSLTKKGKKNHAKRILDDSFRSVSKNLNIPIDLVLVKVFSRLHCFLEIKKRKLGKNTHIIPFPVTSKRQLFLKIKWLLESIKKDNRKVSLSDKLYTELTNILLNKYSTVIQIKKGTFQEALKNRSNIHFRW